MKKWYLVLAIVGIVAILGVLKVRDTQSHETAINTPQGDFGARTSESVREWIDDLAIMEGCALEGTMDTGSLSYGPLCFKKQTYLHYVKKYQIYPYAEEQELLSNIGDSWTQKELTRKMIEEDINNAYHWRTSVVKRGLGLPNL